MTKELIDKLTETATSFNGEFKPTGENTGTLSVPHLDKAQLAKLLNLLNRAKADYTISESRIIATGIDVKITVNP